MHFCFGSLNVFFAAVKMSFLLKPPKDLDQDTIYVNSFSTWLEAFEYYCTLTDPSITEDKKCKMFLTIACLQSQSLLSRLGTDISQFPQKKEALKLHICPVKSIVLEHHKLFTARQLSNESIPQFSARLRNLAATCQFENTTTDTNTNQLIRDNSL